MEQVRKPFEGIWNSIRFNWHLYALSGFILIFILLCYDYIPENLHIYNTILFFFISYTILFSLLISFWIYDLSDLYQLKGMDWLNDKADTRVIVNIHAGFDETSSILKNNFPDAKLMVFDFFDPLQHTEVSIRRARRAYPPYPQTQRVQTNSLPLKEDSVDAVFVILSAHEIRDTQQRTLFFKELNRILKQNGKIIVIEHLRNLPNFLAYSIGFFHFHSKKTWYTSFRLANLVNQKEIKTTPFITSFILAKHGISS